MIRKYIEALCTFTLLISIFNLPSSTITMLPNGFDSMFDKLDDFFHSDNNHKEINLPEEEFLKNQYLQDYYTEDKEYLEKPEAQEFYKDYFDSGN